jgi:hypothetical protein
MTDRTDPQPVDPWASDPTATQRTTVPESPPVAAPQAPPAPPPPAAGPPPSASGWRTPPPDGDWPRRRRDDGRAGSIVFGLVLLAIGGWFLLEQTVGFDLPELRWGELWPVILIAIGLWIVVGAMRRER